MDEAPPMKETTGHPQEAPAAKTRKRRKNSGVIYREIRQIREKRVAFIRVFRVVRGQNASFSSLLSLFAANQWKCLSRNNLHAPRSFPDQAQSSLIKPNQVIF
jgi:hypothetical protein